MIISRLELDNWRNFGHIELILGTRVCVLGANASGKSNLLDVFRFLRTVAQPDGGGLQRALKERGGIGKLRSLHARNRTDVKILVELSDPREQEVHWTYELAFKPEGKGAQRVLVTSERVTHGETVLFSRPDEQDSTDPTRLTQTWLEQISNNAAFRAVADFLAQTTYLHFVPQLLKFGEEISGRMVESDPFGQGLLQRIAATPSRTQGARLNRIQKALEAAVPQFSELRFVKDPITGAPHLEARFNHWRVNGAWQREDQLSDGTLRLIGLLWALQEGDGILLLEEPELSLNDAIVAHIPLMIDRVLRGQKKFGRQVVFTTHSDKLIGAIQDLDAIVLLVPGADGTVARKANSNEIEQVAMGFTPAEVMLPQTHPEQVAQMGLFS
jgi:predicted ATPase